MKISFRKGIGFGLTSGIITTLGLIVGLNSSTHSTKVIIGGILVIAIADSLSDALGIHISEEAENKNVSREIWESTITTFFSKFLMALSFIIPILLLPLNVAIIVSTAWGIFMISLVSYLISKQSKKGAAVIILEHLSIAIAVIIFTYLVGGLIEKYFN